MKYRLYVDEVGNSDIGSSNDPNHRYLSLTGVILNHEYVSPTVFPLLEALKRRYFNSHPDDPVILHRKELVNKRHPFECLRDVDTEKSFNENLLEVLRSLDYKVITVTMDKQEHLQRYKIWQFEPYHYCLTVMVERYVAWLRMLNAVGDVMAESRGGNEDKRLKASFERAYAEGSTYTDASIFETCLTSRQLKVKPKGNNIAGLQLADIIAHPSYRLMLTLKDLYPLLDNFGAKISNILEESKYLRSYSGRIEGWGRKWLP